MDVWATTCTEQSITCTEQSLHLLHGTGDWRSASVPLGACTAFTHHKSSMVLCARSFIDASLPAEQMWLAGCVLQSKEEGNLDQIIDPYLIGTINTCSLNKFVETAENCVADHGTDRPSMADVVSDLKYALQLQASAELAGSSRADEGLKGL
nr:unnamed protein product [Digitaria exilis]